MKSSSAIMYMVFSAVAFSLMSTVVKYVTDFSSYQIVFFRTIGTMLFTVPLIFKKKLPMLGNHKKWLLLRAVAGVVSLTCFFESLKYLDLGTAVSLRYTSPIFATILALLFLREKIKGIQWFLFLIAFVGVLIIKGFHAEMNSIGLILVLTSAFFLGVVFVVLRRIGDAEHPLVVINYFMVIAFVFGGVMSISRWKHPNFLEWLLFLSLGVFGYVGQLYLTKAFRYDETSVVAPLKYLEVLFVLVIGAFWFEEDYSLWTLFGVCLIMLGLILNVLLKKINQ